MKRIEALKLAKSLEDSKSPIPSTMDEKIKSELSIVPVLTATIVAVQLAAAYQKSEENLWISLQLSQDELSEARAIIAKSETLPSILKKLKIYLSKTVNEYKKNISVDFPAKIAFKSLLLNLLHSDVILSQNFPNFLVLEEIPIQVQESLFAMLQIQIEMETTELSPESDLAQLVKTTECKDMSLPVKQIRWALEEQMRQTNEVAETTRQSLQELLKTSADQCQGFLMLTQQMQEMKNLHQKMQESFEVLISNLPKQTEPFINLFKKLHPVTTPWGDFFGVLIPTTNWVKTSTTHKSPPPRPTAPITIATVLPIKLVLVPTPESTPSNQTSSLSRSAPPPITKTPVATIESSTSSPALEPVRSNQTPVVLESSNASSSSSHSSSNSSNSLLLPDTTSPAMPSSPPPILIPETSASSSLPTSSTSTPIKPSPQPPPPKGTPPTKTQTGQPAAPKSPAPLVKSSSSVSSSQSPRIPPSPSNPQTPTTPAGRGSIRGRLSVFESPTSGGDPKTPVPRSSPTGGETKQEPGTDGVTPRSFLKIPMVMPGDLPPRLKKLGTPESKEGQEQPTAVETPSTPDQVSSRVLSQVKRGNPGLAASLAAAAAKRKETSSSNTNSNP